MLDDCGPVVVSPLNLGEFDSLEYVLLGCLRSSGNNDVEGSDEESNSDEADSDGDNDADGTSDEERANHWWSESDDGGADWSESLDGLITMNTARTGKTAADAFEPFDAAALAFPPEPEHQQQQKHQSEAPSPNDHEPYNDTETADGKRVASRKREVFAMIFENLKNSVFKRRVDREARTTYAQGAGHRWPRSPRTARVHTALSTAPSVSSTLVHDDQEAWSLSCRRFTSLKHFVWPGGAPQFSFLASTSTGDVVVRDVLSDEARTAGIQVGDVLEAVADVSLRGMGLDEVTSLIATVDKPAVFRFRADAWTSAAKRWEHELFHVILRDQKLGATFTSDGPRHIPVVSRVARSGAPAAAFGIRAGDVLVAVNGQDAVSMGLGRVMKFVKSAPRPICFTFQRARITTSAASRRLEPAGPSRSANQSLELDTSAPVWRQTDASDAGVTSDVLIVWKEGPLGVTLVPDLLSGLPVVNRLTGKGTSRGLERVHHGYLLHSVNGQKLVGSGMDEWQSELSGLRKPALLVFKAPKTCGSFCDVSSDSDLDSGSGSLTFTSPSSPCAPLEMVETAATDQILASLATGRLTGIAGGNNSDLESLGCRSVLDSDDCYLVTWNEPRLGLGLSLEPQKPRFQPPGDDGGRAHSPSRRVPVVRVVQSSCRLQFPGNPIGDWLVSVNGASATGLTETALRDLVASATKPAVLRFHRPPPRQTPDAGGSNSSPTSWWSELHDSDDEETPSRLPCVPTEASPLTTTHYCYNLLWPSGPALGLTFASYLDADRGGQVVVYIKRVAPSGHAAKTRLVAKGDELATVNAAALPPARGFDETMHWLARQKRPLVLGFARPLVERDSGRS